MAIKGEGGPVTHTLLRQYRIKPGEWEPFLDVWRRIVEVRKRFGFKVLFALVDDQQNIFTWAISYEGDIEEAARCYYLDPERVSLEFVEKYVLDWKVTTVRQEPV